MIGVSSTQKKQDPASKDAQTARGSSLQPSWFFFPFKTIYLFPFWENYNLSEDTCPDCQRRAKKKLPDTMLNVTSLHHPSTQ